MDFKKKLKTRLYFGISYIVIGVAMIIVALTVNGTSEYLSPFGTALLVIGIARVRNHSIITKSDETIKIPKKPNSSLIIAKIKSV